MSQILIIVAAIISLFLGLFVFVRLIKQVKQGKMQLAENYTAVYWAFNKLNFARLVVVNFVITLFYFGMFTLCLFRLGFIEGAM